MPRASQPLPYTASQYALVLADLILLIRITFVWPPWKGIPSIILPILPFRSGALDELYPDPANLWSLILQLIFTTVQAIFIISIPISAIFGLGFPLLPPFVGAYVPIWLIWILTFIYINHVLSDLLLNGFSRVFTSQTSLSASELRAHQDEKWVFVNGVAAGSHWTQSNLDRLSLAFRREIIGIHNPTRGILFDLIEVIIERTFDYATPGTRNVYRHLLNIVSDRRYTKIILVLHSQGAIEGGLALDWLFATVPGDQLSRIEVYTFGNAANHFNNPIESGMTSSGQRVDLDLNGNESDDTFQQGRILKHIEHYANSGDYVSKFGILNFRPLPQATLKAIGLPIKQNIFHMYDSDTHQELENRYVGRLFIRSGSGHQLNGNYLDNFFTLNKDLTMVADGNSFMDGIVNNALLDEDDIVVVNSSDSNNMATQTDASRKSNVDQNMGTKKTKVNGQTLATGQVLMAKNVSRLWMYRNGATPDD